MHNRPVKSAQPRLAGVFPVFGRAKNRLWPRQKWAARTLIGFVAVCLALVAWQVQRAFALTTTFIAHYDNGTLNADYAFGSGTASTVSNLPNLLSTGYGGTGGSVLNSSGRTLKYSLANNLSTQKGKISIKYQLPWFMGTDYTVFNSVTYASVDYDPATDYYYLSDVYNHRIIKTKADGTGWVTLGTQGAGNMQFYYPKYIKYDPASDYIYVVDSSNYRIVKTKIDGTGWTTYGSYASSYASGKFNAITGLDYDPVDDYVYVIDESFDKIIRLKMDGSSWTAYGSTGVSTGQFYSPRGIAYDKNTGYIYVGELYSTYDRIDRLKIDGTGWATYGASGTGTGQFGTIRDIDFDPATSNLYVYDAPGDQVSRVIRTKFDGTDWLAIPSLYSYNYSYNAGSQGFTYDATNNRAIYPTGLAGLEISTFESGQSFYALYGSGTGNIGGYAYLDYDATTGYYYIADYNNSRIIKTKIDGTGWTTYGSSGYGIGYFRNPADIDYDSATEYIYVADYNNSRVVRTKIDGTGWMSIPVLSPTSIDLDATNGVIYVTSSNRHSISKIPLGGFTVGYFSTSGSSSSLRFNGPCDIEYDSASGYYYIADTANHRIVKTMADGTGWTTYGTNGTGTGNFSSPRGIAYDASTDYIYVADSGNNRIVKTTISGTGWTVHGSLGTGTNNFNTPYDVDFDNTTSNLYIADRGNDRIVRTQFGGTGWTTYGSAGSSGTGRFGNITGIDYDSATGYVYASDGSNNQIVKTQMDGTGWTTYRHSTLSFSYLGYISYDPATDYIYVADYNGGQVFKTKIDGTGFSRIPAYYPYGVDIGPSGQITFTTTRNTIGAISTDAVEYGTTPSTYGSGEGYFYNPSGIQIDSSTGYIYVADNNNNRIVKTKIDGTGWTTFGSYGGGVNQFYGPNDIQYDPSTGELCVMDYNNYRIVRTKMDGSVWKQLLIPTYYRASMVYEPSSGYINYGMNSTSHTTMPEIIRVKWNDGIGNNRVSYNRTISSPTATAYDSSTGLDYSLVDAGQAIVQHAADGSLYYKFGSYGTGTNQFNGAQGLDVISATGELLVADSSNHRLVKTKMDGTGWTTYGSYGTGTNQFSYPSDVYYDNDTGYVYVADASNNRIVKTKLDGSVWQVFPAYGPRNVSVEDGYIYIVSNRSPYLTKIKDSTISYLAGDQVTTGTSDIDYDEASGYAYIADYNANRIIKMKLDGSNVTILGGTVGSGTGQFNSPRWIDYDPASDYIYVSDSSNHRIVKTKIDGTGWTTLGGPSSGNVAGMFYTPAELRYDSSTGYIYVADFSNHRIVKTKIDGTGWTTLGGPSSGNTTGKFYYPYGLDYDSASDYIYVADYYNHRIVKTKIDATGWTTYGTNGTGMGNFYNPRCVSYDSVNDLVYVCDGSSNYRMVVTNMTGSYWRAYNLGANANTIKYNPSSGKAYWSISGTGPFVMDMSGFDSYHGSTSLSSYFRGKFSGGYWYLAEADNSNNSRIVKTDTAGTDFTSLGTYGSSSLQFNNPYTLDVDASTSTIHVPNNGSGQIVRTTISGGGWTSVSAGQYETEKTILSTNGSQQFTVSFYPTESKLGIVLNRGNGLISVGKSSVLTGKAGDWQTLEVSYDNTSGVTAKINDTTVLQKNLTWSSFSWGDSFYVGNDAFDTTKSFNSPVDEVEISSTGADTTNPSIPVLSSALDSTGGSTSLSASGWNKYSAPYFSWTATDDGGAGIKDYLVYYGTDASADPYLKGTAQTAANYTAGSMTSGTTYYLIVQTRDGVGNLSTKTTLFTYRYDSTAPESPTTVTVTPPGNSRSTHFDFVWPTSGAGTGSDAGGSGLLGYQYRFINKNGDAVADWSTAELVGTADFTIPAPDTNFIGTNKIEIRAVDNAGNVDATPLTNNFYYSAAATAPRNLTASPSTSASSPSSTNSFSFDWDEPSAYPGQGYYYSINVLPTADNKLTVADSSLSAAAYASQQGRNTLYVLAADGDSTNFDGCSSISGNPEVDACSMVYFYAVTPAPGYPTAVKVYDISNRDTSEYSVALKWSPPTSLGTGFDGYNIYRSATSDAGYAKIGSSQGTSYIDDNLTKETPYYYQLKSKDNTGQESVSSQTINITPTGKYTNPPILKNDVINVSTKAYSAIITWETQRTDSDEANAGRSSSFVKYGLTRDAVGKENGGWTVGDPNKVEAHSVNLTGLDPETVYYYQVMWEDIDGNQGSSEVKTLATKEKPQIANVTVDNITLKSANINWESINVVSARISYCSNNSCQDTVISTTADQPTHTVNITNLNHSTDYRFTISTTDIDGNVTPSDAYSFSTLTMPLTEGDLKMDQDTTAPTTTYRLRWVTNIPTTTILNYTKEGGQTLTVSQAEYTTEHDVTVSNLADQSKYIFEATGVDDHGNRVDNPLTSTVSTPQDSRAPGVSNLTIEIKSSGASGSQKDQIVASWETDELSTSQIEYGAGISGSEYTQKTAEDAALTNYHVVIVNELEPSKMYHLRVVSRDAAGNAGYSDDTTAITGKLQNSAIDLIINSLRKSLGWLSTLFQ